MSHSNSQPFRVQETPRLSRAQLRCILYSGRLKAVLLFFILIIISTIFHYSNSSSPQSLAVRATKTNTRLLLTLRQWSSYSRSIETCEIPNLASHSAIYQTNAIRYHPFRPISVDESPASLYRRPDILNTLEDYKHHATPGCNVSSLDLHKPFSPLCTNRRSFLEAFSSGGRIGFDAPFIPRGCDMRWYTTQETCEVFGRFEKVIVVGDSMMRHVVGALNVLLRQDLGYGAVTGWNFNDEEKEKCFCIRQFDVKACSIQGIYRTTDVLKHDPDSFACTKVTNSHTGETTSPVNLIVEAMLKFPLDPVEVQRLQDLLPTQRPKKPIAFIFGHGLWNDLDLQATVNWLDGILAAIHDKAPYLHPRSLPRDMTPQDQPLSHMLFMTPNAAGTRKPDQWVTSQGDKALQVFEHSLRDLIFEPGERWYGKGIEHIGTWNMSIQMDKWDGVHLDLKGNLVKAMGIMNWLAFVEVERW